MKFYIPSNLNLPELLASKGYEQYTRYMHLNNMYYIIHLIYLQRIIYKQADFIPLKAIYLRNIVRNYKIYRDILENIGVIECDHIAIQRKKSFGHKIRKEYSCVPATELEIDSPILEKSINRWKGRRLPCTEVHQHLYNFLTKTNINPSVLNEIDNFDVEKRNAYWISIRSFLNKDYFFYNDDYGRIHTNITGLKSLFRKYLSYKENNLTSIDIINSQPLLFFLLYINVNNSLLISSSSSSSSSLIAIDRGYTHPHHAPFCNSLSSDVVLYRDIAESGTLYSYLGKMLSMANREEVKKYLFKEVLFGRNVAHSFIELFPTLGKFLIEFKKKGYKRVAWAMQRLESKLVITEVCGRIMERAPNLYITTIHDSIMTVSDGVEFVRDIFSEVYGEYGLKPSFTIRSY